MELAWVRKGGWDRGVPGPPCIHFRSTNSFVISLVFVACEQFYRGKGEFVHGIQFSRTIMMPLKIIERINYKLNDQIPLTRREIGEE